MRELDDLLGLANNGDQSASERLFEITYKELRALARSQLKSVRRDTLLETTELLHESYLRFRKAGNFFGTNSAQFFLYAARVMRSVVVDFLRKEQVQRRGYGVEHIALSLQLAESVGADQGEMIRVNEALDDLQRHDERLQQVVAMRYWVGMNDTEIAAALGVTDRTVQRDVEKAKAILFALLQ
jgi:RNA polymerase sigma factor (TIGR02999 family)